MSKPERSITTAEMLAKGINLHGYTLTKIQRRALESREAKIKERNGRKTGHYRPCIGCYAGIRTVDQGSVYCTRCIKKSSPQS